MHRPGSAMRIRWTIPELLEAPTLEGLNDSPRRTSPSIRCSTSSAWSSTRHATRCTRCARPEYRHAGEQRRTASRFAGVCRLRPARPALARRRAAATGDYDGTRAGHVADQQGRGRQGPSGWRDGGVRRAPSPPIPTTLAVIWAASCDGLGRRLNRGFRPRPRAAAAISSAR